MSSRTRVGQCTKRASKKANINKYRSDTHNHLSVLATLTVNQLQTYADYTLSLLQRLFTVP